jgi:hypothetical protein
MFGLNKKLRQKQTGSTASSKQDEAKKVISNADVSKKAIPDLICKVKSEKTLTISLKI